MFACFQTYEKLSANKEKMEKLKSFSFYLKKIQSFGIQEQDNEILQHFALDANTREAERRKNYRLSSIRPPSVIKSSIVYCLPGEESTMKANLENQSVTSLKMTSPEMLKSERKRKKHIPRA